MHGINGINIVIASGSEQVQKCLREAFTQRAANVRLCGFLNMQFVRQLEQKSDADVILIDMNDSYEEDEEALDLLLEQTELPILFHDNDFDDINDPNQGCGFSEQAIDKLVYKLARLVASHGIEQEPLADREPLANKEPEQEPDASDDLVLLHDSGSYKPPLIIPVVEPVNTRFEKEVPVKQKSSGKRLNVWVLGASIGGPEAVKAFLSCIPEKLPVAFVLAQHLGEGFVTLLANQLDRVSGFKVKEAVVGDTIKHGEVIVVPIENRMSMDENGQVNFIEEKWKGHYKPSINCVITDVTESFKTRSGVIIFSGMGTDGVLASQEFAEKYHGIVWAQDSQTCVVSSMPDSVRKANLVTYSGSPEALANKITRHYSGK